jgi:hypothetical protein
MLMTTIYNNYLRNKNDIITYDIIYMTTTVQDPSCDCNSTNCDIAKTSLCPDCFKLRIGYDPSVPTYNLSLCNNVVVFTNNCCLGSGVGVILRIPMTFVQNCTMYRVNNIDVTRPITVTYFLANGSGSAVATTLAVDGYLNITIPYTALSFTQNGECDCVASFTFDTFNIPVTKLPGYCPCPALCNTVKWTYTTLIMENTFG